MLEGSWCDLYGLERLTKYQGSLNNVYRTSKLSQGVRKSGLVILPRVRDSWLGLMANREFYALLNGGFMIDGVNCTLMFRGLL